MRRNNKELLPPGLTYLADNIISKDNFLGAAKGTRAKWAEDLNLLKEAETIFFAGCGYQYASELESLTSLIQKIDKSAISAELAISLATGLPPIHIALVGMEKLVPTLGDAFRVAEVTWRYANYTVPSYVSLVSGPSKTGDIEKVTTYGAHGPKELHVIFMDAGRTRLARI